MNWSATLIKKKKEIFSLTTMKNSFQVKKMLKKKKKEIFSLTTMKNSFQVKKMLKKKI